MEEARRSIQDLIPPARSKPLRPTPPPPVPPPQHDTPQPPVPPQPTPPPAPPTLPPNPRIKKGGGMNWRLWGIVLGIVIVLGAAFAIASVVLHRATVSVSVRAFEVPVAGSFEASPTGTNLAFAVKNVEETESKQVASTGTVRAEDTAEGTVTLKNAYSTSGQRLIANTRLESADGRIYHIRGPVTVPGYTGSGASKVPGAIDVEVYASKAGEEYNITGPAEFTIPGLKDFPEQYAGMTAHLAGAIDGGFVGDRAVVSDDIREQAIEDLSTILGQEARARFVESLGDDDLVFPDSITVTYTTLADRPSGSGAEITVKATASAPVFSKAMVAKVIASEGALSYTGPLMIKNLEELGATLAESKTAGNMTLSMAGAARLVAVYDRDAFRGDLAGASRRDVGAVLAAYPAVADMQISVYPFWKGSLPTDTGRITLSEAEVVAP